MEEYKKCILVSLERSTKMDLLVEKFYEGHEIDVDMLVQNNEGKPETSPTGAKILQLLSDELK